VISGFRYLRSSAAQCGCVPPRQWSAERQRGAPPRPVGPRRRPSAL